MNTFDDDNEVGFFEEPRRRPPRDRGRRPQRSGARRPGPPAGSNPVLRLAGLVALAIAIVFGLVLACSGGSKQDYASYFAAMEPLAHDSANVGAEFAGVIGTPLTMDSFQSDLASWKQQELNDYVAAQRLQPPGPLQSAHAQALATFQLRAAGLAGLASTLTLAQSKHDSAAAAAAALASDAQLLSASDVVWEQLYKLPATQVLEDRGVTNVIVPPSQLVTSPDLVSEHSLKTLYERFATPATSGGGGNGTAKHGSNLIGTNFVESGTSAALSKSSTTTVKCCSNLAIDVLFNNSGHYVETQIHVTLTIKVPGESQPAFTKTETVAQLAPGEQTTVSFSNIGLPTGAFGPTDSISVSIAPVKGEARLDNNEATYPVLFELEPT